MLKDPYTIRTLLLLRSVMYRLPSESAQASFGLYRYAAVAARPSPFQEYPPDDPAKAAIVAVAKEYLIYVVNCCVVRSITSGER